MGHVVNVCNGKMRRAKCGGDHEYGKCGLDTKVKCCDCDGEHSAAYGGCEIQQKVMEAER
jgi:hypothetical protein